MTHIILIGDSILDNGPYVPNGHAVIDHLRAMLPSGWQTTLLALDGSTINGIHGQLERLPADATHIILSVGGNDALGHQGILTAKAESAAQVLGQLAEISAGFERVYAQMLADVRQRQLPTALCTIYNPNFADARFQRLAVTAATVFNDAILRLAFGAGVPVLDLRLICNEASDYANPIEPSSAGGRKIAVAIQRVVSRHDFQPPTDGGLSVALVQVGASLRAGRPVQARKSAPLTCRHVVCPAPGKDAAASQFQPFRSKITEFIPDSRYC